MADKKLTFTIDAADVDTTLTDFPAVIQLGNALAPTSVDDDFTGTNGDDPNGLLWNDLVVYTGGTHTALISSNTLAWTASSPSSASTGVLSTKYTLTGDFSIQMDMSNESFNAISTTFGLRLSGDTIGKTYIAFAYSSGDKFEGEIDGVAGSSTSRTNDYGKIRLVRSGTTLTTSYQDGSGSWTTYQTDASFPTEDVSFFIYSYGGTGVSFTITVDNVVLNSGTVVWPEGYTKGSGSTEFDSSEVFDELTGGKDSYTKLLIHADEADASTTIADSSDSAHTITANGDAAVKDFNADGNSIVNYSGFFNGTDAYLTVPDHADWPDGNSVFTIECWVFPTNEDGSGISEIISQDGSSGADYLTLLIYDGSHATNPYKVQFNVCKDVTTKVTLLSSAITFNQWNHIAVTFDGTDDWNLWINGDLSVNDTDSTTFDALTSSLYVGRLSWSASNYLNGYLSGIAIHGAEIYTTAFTPPLTIAEMTNDSNTVLFLDFTEIDQGDTPTTFTDSSASAHTVTNASSKVSGCTFWWSGAVEFDGTGDYLSIPNHDDWTLADDNFTIDFLLLAADITSAKTGWVCGDWEWSGGTDRVWRIERTVTTDLLRFYCVDSSGTAIADISSNSALEEGKLIHVAIVRNGTSFKMYIDGVVQTSTDTSSSSLSTSINPITIGGIWASGASALYEGASDISHVGYISEVRVSKGIARHTAAFTPSTKQYRGSWERIHITDASDNELYCEVENWDLDNEKATIHVKVPTVSSSANTVLTLDYDDTNSDNSLRTAANASDDFTGTNGDAPDPFLWGVDSGADTSSLINSNKLRSVITSAIAHSEVISRYEISGDFDIQVDFDAVVFPATNHSFISLLVYGESDNTAYLRLVKGTSSQYYQFSTWVDPDWDTWATPATTDTAGKFRMTRSGSAVSVYYWNGSSWTQIDSAQTFTGDDVKVCLSVQTTAAISATADFDNFTVNSADSITGFIGEIGDTAGQQVWDSNFVFVSHMAQDPSGSAPQILDSTSNGNDGTSVGTMVSGDLIDGDVGKSIDFNGTTQRIGISDSSELSLDTHVTLEAKITPDDISGNQGIIAKGTDATDQNYYLRLADAKLQMFFRDSGNTANVTLTSDNTSLITADTEQIVAFTHTWGVITASELFHDGTAVASTWSGGTNTSAAFTNTEQVQLASRFDTDYFDGAIGEVRISNVVRSDDWIEVTAKSLIDDLFEAAAYESGSTIEVAATSAVVVSTNTPTLHIAELLEPTADSNVVVTTSTPILNLERWVSAESAVVVTTSEPTIISLVPVSANSGVTVSTSTPVLDMTKNVDATSAVVVSTSTPVLTLRTYVSANSDVAVTTSTPIVVMNRLDVSASSDVVVTTSTPNLANIIKVSATSAVVTTTSTPVVASNIGYMSVVAGTPTILMVAGSDLDISASTPTIEMVGSNSIVGHLGMQVPDIAVALAGDTENVSTLGLIAPTPTILMTDIAGNIGYMGIIAPLSEIAMVDVGNATEYVLDIQAGSPTIKMKVINTPYYNILRHTRGEVR